LIGIVGVTGTYSNDEDDYLAIKGVQGLEMGRIFRTEPEKHNCTTCTGGEKSQETGTGMRRSNSEMYIWNTDEEDLQREEEALAEIQVERTLPRRNSEE